MADKLTDAQRVILAAAAARDDGNVLPIPASVNAKGGALSAVLRSLLGRGLLVERAATNDEPAWRTDEVTGKFALVITPAGLQAIGVEPDPGPTAATQPEGAAKAPKVLPRHRRRARRQRPAVYPNVRPRCGSPRSKRSSSVCSVAPKAPACGKSRPRPAGRRTPSAAS